MKRNDLILLFWNQGHDASHIAEQFKLTDARIYQILKEHREAGRVVRASEARPLIVRPDHLLVPLAARGKGVVAYAMIDHEDRAVAEGRNWCRTVSGYVMARRAEGTGYDYLHRLILPGEGLVADHISGNKLDCRRSNLRLCTQLENSRNRAKHKRNTSGFKGVSQDRRSGIFVAAITVNRRAVQLGRFATAAEAAAAYDAAAIKYFGDFARPNFRAHGDGVLAEVA